MNFAMNISWARTLSARRIDCNSRAKPGHDGTRFAGAGFPLRVPHLKGDDMRGVLLWLVGIPIPVIILLYLFHVI
jgi:hypothetical protein